MQRQLSLFSPSELAEMRDRTKKRNYSPELEAFRRDHQHRRDHGKAQRHAARIYRNFQQSCGDDPPRIPPRPLTTPRSVRPAASSGAASREVALREVAPSGVAPSGVAPLPQTPVTLASGGNGSAIAPGGAWPAPRLATPTGRNTDNAWTHSVERRPKSRLPSGVSG
jgi:hypothetical protein